MRVDSDRGILTLSPDLTVCSSYTYGYDGPNPNMTPYIGLLGLYIYRHLHNENNHRGGKLYECIVYPVCSLGWFKENSKNTVYFLIKSGEIKLRRSASAETDNFYCLEAPGNPVQNISFCTEGTS